MYSFLFVLTSVVTLVLSSWIYLYQWPTEKVMGDMEDIADSIEIIKESLENIAQTIGDDMSVLDNILNNLPSVLYR